MTTPPTLEALLAEREAQPIRGYGVCPAYTPVEGSRPRSFLNCTRPLQHPSDWHADFRAPGLKSAVVLCGVWPC